MHGHLDNNCFGQVLVSYFYRYAHHIYPHCKILVDLNWAGGWMCLLLLHGFLTSVLVFEQPLLSLVLTPLSLTQNWAREKLSELLTLQISCHQFSIALSFVITLDRLCKRGVACTLSCVHKFS